MSLDESGSNFETVAATLLLFGVTRGSSDAYGTLGNTYSTALIILSLPSVVIP